MTITIPAWVRVIAYIAGGVGGAIVNYLSIRGVIDRQTADFVTATGGTLVTTLAVAHITLPDASASTDDTPTESNNSLSTQ